MVPDMFTVKGEETVMTKRIFVGIVLVMALAAAAATAEEPRVTGVVMAATDVQLQVMTKSRETTTVTIDDQTHFVKWVNHAPWVHNNETIGKAAAVGSCIEVELRARDGRVAKLVRVNSDGAGTRMDPCKAIRVVDKAATKSDQ
jgi:hypothetical protein